ncbi:MAG: STAS domain-containing protein [Caldilineaceae bacterium]|nr:STAS domain-containing protein [Caldilineaceae bacterium]
MQLILSSGVKWELVILAGNITSGDIDELEELLQRFLTIGHYNVVLDLARVTYIGSAGLALLIRYTNAFRRWERGDLHLAAISDPVMNLLQVTGLVTEERSHFSIYPTVDEASAVAKRQVSS